MSKPYIILRAGTVDALEMAVGGHITAGYSPIGGPFNASPFAPPHNTIAQAMVLVPQTTPKKEPPAIAAFSSAPVGRTAGTKQFRR